MTHDMLLHLLYQVPAIFTAVPMLARLLPVKLPERAIPLFYFLVSMLVMALPGSMCLALGAAGLVSMIHVRLGEKVSTIPEPDTTGLVNNAALVWDYIVTHLPSPSMFRRNTILYELAEDATPGDDDPEDENTEYQEPPRPPEPPIARRIPHLD